MATGFLYDPRYLSHDTGEGHPERPERLSVTIDYLKTLPWFSKLKNFAPREGEEDWIAAVHSPAYIRHAEQVCKSGYSHLDTPDVGISRESFEIAKLAVGGALELADRVLFGEIQNGFALLRPPGHHAEANLAMGFCLFNNIAILARYLQKKHGLEKILILDWDVHHGNGTQHTFYEDASVFYISLHQYPFYPGTGAVTETGSGCGKGATLNCPMEAGSGDKDYETAFRLRILPKIEKFKPDIVLISAGFDAHVQDPLANICLTTEFFGWMSERMMEAADKHAKGRLISLLEGGYNLQALPRCIATHLAVLSDSSSVIPSGREGSCL
jgi:acetoin utilization deacetylase AcuC-like enzyme